MGKSINNLNGISNGGIGGQLSLEQMDLDRKDDFQGDAFDPFNFGNSNKKEQVNVKLQA